MKFISKKTIAALVAGAFILAGAAGSFIVEAAKSDEGRPAIEHRQVDPDKAAGRMAELYGIDKATILTHLSNGMKLRDINRAAFLAEVSGKSLDEVVALKTTDNTWKDVAKTLNVTKEQMKATRAKLMSNQLNVKLGLDKQTTQSLFEQGYRPRDVAVAGLLSQNTGKPADEILALKKINNTWPDVANTLGVDKDTMKQDMQKLRQAFPHGGKRHY